MITIYGSNVSRATRCLWVLEELGLPYEQVKVNRQDGSLKAPEYLAINPAGKVPTLKDDDTVVSESYAINLYLAQQYGAGRLWPTRRGDQAAALQWSFWAAAEAESPVITLLMEHIYLPEAARDPGMVKRAEEALAPRLKLLNDVLASRACVAGAEFSIGDLNLACSLMGLNRVAFDLAPYPNVDRWLKACLSRPAQQKVAALPQP